MTQSALSSDESLAVAEPEARPAAAVEMSGQPATPARLKALQRAAGNRAVVALLQRAPVRTPAPAVVLAREGKSTAARRTPTSRAGRTCRSARRSTASSSRSTHREKLLALALPQLKELPGKLPDVSVESVGLEKKFKALGFEITPGLDLGKFTETILQSTKLTIARNLGQGITASVSASTADSAEKRWTGAGDARLGTSSVYGAYGLKLGEKGALDQSVGFGVYGLTGQYGWGTVATAKLETTAMVKFNPDGSALLDASALYKSAELGASSSDSRVRSPAASPTSTCSPRSAARTRTRAATPHRRTGPSTRPTLPRASGSTTSGSGSSPAYACIRGSRWRTPRSPACRRSSPARRSRASSRRELSYEADLVKGTTQAGGKLSISAEDAEWAVRAAFTDGELSELGARMEVGGKEDAVKFLVDASLSSAQGVDKFALQTMLTARVGKFALKLDASVASTEGGKTPGTTAAFGSALIYELPKHYVFGLTGDVAYGPIPGADPCTTGGPGALFGRTTWPFLVKGSVMFGGPKPVFGINLVRSF